MLKKALHFVFTLCGMLLGLGVSQTLLNYFQSKFGAIDIYTVWAINGIAIFIFAIIFSTFYTSLGGRTELPKTNIFPRMINWVPVEELIPGVCGLIAGGFIATSFSNIILKIDALNAMALNIIISVMLFIGLCYYGWTTGRLFGRMYKDKISSFFSTDLLKRRVKSARNATPKVFDTSVIIDGRIHEILKTGFLEGEIIIPDFVMVELRHISDSADDLKRARGRRGLEILNAIQKEFGVQIYDTSSNKDIRKIPEVDLKLLKLAEILNGVVVTNDYNLNRCAGVEGIGILNINELANTLKPVALPGEVMMVTPVKDGKTDDQAVAYLDDGTMIVVQNGHKLIGKTIKVTVTSVIQTSAGRMIFAKP